jgi:oligoendopeptidase F
MATIAERKRSWIDAPTRPGKAPGAFAHPTVPSVHPYVLLNYQGKTRDVMTLAHELGHGVHQVLAADQGLLMSQTPLTLAETASVFGEMLTFRALLDRAEDRRERKIMLAAKVEDMINTVVRQIAFYSFERDVHLARNDGELTSERLGEIWLKVQGERLGPAIGWAQATRLLDLHSASSTALLCLRLRLRRLPGELALRRLRARRERFSGEVFRDAEGRRHQAPQGAPRALRA